MKQPTDRSGRRGTRSPRHHPSARSIGAPASQDNQRGQRSRLISSASGWQKEGKEIIVAYGGHRSCGSNTNCAHQEPT